ncbi:MAG: FAD-dependent monooxygenase [Pseudomonadota bacterium]|nr:FAD-dependent monooxygenase [Pseudomonadota bacterium]
MNNKEINKVRRIAVVGGGIGGLTFAIAMRHHGIDVDIYEQADELREVGAAVALSANASRFYYGKWGMGESLDEAAFEVSAGICRDGKTGELICRHEAGQAYRDLFGAPYLGIHRAELQRILSTKVGMDRIHLGKRLEHIDDSGDQVVLHFANGSKAEADIVIGADGVRSTIRNLLLGYEDYLYAGYSGFRGIVPIEKMPSMPEPSALQIWMGESSHCVHYPIGGDRKGDVNFLLVERTPATWPVRQGIMPAADGEHLRNFKDWHPAVLEMISANTLDTLNERWGMLYRMTLGRWSKGRITLIGDAAHPVIPNHGQGANQSIEDAVVLSDCIAAAGSQSISETFERYERLRHGRTRKVAYASIATGDVLHLPPGENRDRRNARFASHEAMLHHLDWMHGFDCGNLNEPNERQGGTWL